MFVLKRLVLLLMFMVLMGLVYAGGAYVLPDYDILITPEPLPPPYMPPEEENPVYTELGSPAVIMYGDAAVFCNNNDPLHAYIRFPQAGNPTDEAIYEWAFELFGEMSVRYNTGVELSPQDFGEINVQFDSYVIDNRYAGIHQYGWYSTSMVEQPSEVLKTFNIDLTIPKLLEPGDILNLEDPEYVISLLSLRLLVEHPITDGYHEFMDEEWFTHLLIAPDGILVYLPQGEFLPERFGTLTVTLPYGDLGASLLIRQDAPLPEMPSYTPPEEILPDPTPDPTPEADPDGSNSEDGETAEGNTGGESSEGSDPDSAAETTEGETNEGETAEGETLGEETTGEETSNEETLGEEPIEEEPAEEPRQLNAPVNLDRPVIALTFDDGPGSYTEELLDLIEKYNVRATFFTIGNIAHTRTETLQRAVKLRCEVAGHSWNHKNLAKMAEEDVRLQIETTQSTIEEITGAPVPFFRPPYGAVSDTMKTVAEELDLSIINWTHDTDPEDWRSKDADEIYDFIMENIETQAIILSHDVYESTLEAYKRIIPELIIQGYQIVTVTELITATNNRFTPGYVYYDGRKAEAIVN